MAGTEFADQSHTRRVRGSPLTIMSATTTWFSSESTRGLVVMTVRQHRGDLPDLSRYTVTVAINTETMGLNPHRDRLCVVQLSNGDGSADVVQIPKGHTDAPNLKALFADPKITKIFHFARFDIAALYHSLGVM